MIKLTQTPGFYWAPAGMEVLYNVSLAKGAHPDTLPPTATKHTFVRAERKLSYWEYLGFNTRIRYMGSGVSLKDGWHPGRELLQSIGFGLYNASDHPLSPKMQAKTSKIRALCHCIQDSGGFQLFSGVSDFIDPDQLVLTHDAYADSGVGLDLPMSLVGDPTLVLGGARMLAANNVRMLKNRATHWRLMNVSHGLTPALRGAWQKIALQEPGDSLCIAGLRGSIDQKAVGKNPVDIAIHLLIGMLHPNDYPHYHLLGLSSPMGMLLGGLAANLHQKIVTSDSTTYLNGQMYGNTLGLNISKSKTNTRYLACSCPMCNWLEREHWLVASPYTTSVHNAFTINRWRETLNMLAATSLKAKWSIDTLLRAVSDSGIPLNVTDGTMRKAIGLILNTTKYEAALQLDATNRTPTAASLFTKTSNTCRTTNADKQRMVSVLRTYEKYHGKKFL